MRKPAAFALAALLLVFLVSTVVLYQKYRGATADYDEMKSSQDAA